MLPDVVRLLLLLLFDTDVRVVVNRLVAVVELLATAAVETLAVPWTVVDDVLSEPVNGVAVVWFTWAVVAF